MRLVIRFLKDENAATAIEYGLIAAGVALAIITVIKGVGKAQHYVLLNLIAVELGQLLPRKYRHWSAWGHYRHIERTSASSSTLPPSANRPSGRHRLRAQPALGLFAIAAGFAVATLKTVLIDHPVLRYPAYRLELLPANARKCGEGAAV